jgi:hypothetical protein
MGLIGLPIVVGEFGHTHRRRQLLLCRLQDLDQQCPRDGEQVGDLRIGQPIEDLAGTPLRDDQVVASKHRQVLGQVGCLEAGVGEQIRHRHVVAPGEDLQHAHSHRVGETLEEVGLHLIERAMGVGVFRHALTIP